MNDPLYDWKKHSGFKKGLATDVVFGDERKKWMGNAAERFASTMHTDFFSLNQNSKSDEGSVGHILEQSTATQPRKNATSIRFGDLSTENTGRFESVTSANYKAPPSNSFQPHGNLNTHFFNGNYAFLKSLDSLSSCVIRFQSNLDLKNPKRILQLKSITQNQRQQHALPMWVFKLAKTCRLTTPTSNALRHPTLMPTATLETSKRRKTTSPLLDRIFIKEIEVTTKITPQ